MAPCFYNPRCVLSIEVKSGSLAAEALSKRTSEYLALRNLAYPDVDARPKHHYALHVEAEPFMIDCFVHERKHQDFKGFGEKLTDPSAFCRSVLAHALWQQAKMRTCSALRSTNAAPCKAPERNFYEESLGASSLYM